MNLYKAETGYWYLERVIRLVAGVFVLTGLILAHTVNPWWAILPALVGVNLTIFAFSGFCPMANFLHLLGFRESRDGAATCDTGNLAEKKN